MKVIILFLVRETSLACCVGGIVTPDKNLPIHRSDES